MSTTPVYDGRNKSRMIRAGLALFFAALIFQSAPGYALGLDCDNVDGLIKDAHESANEEFRLANKLQAAANAGPSLWDTVTDSLAVWNPFATSVGDAVQGAAQDVVVSACGTIAKRAAAGIDLTNKLIQQADVLGQSEGAAVTNANARSARQRGHGWMREVNRLLRWKQKHCQCTEDEKGNAVLDGDDSTKGDLLDWLERTSHGSRETRHSRSEAGKEKRGK